MKKILPLLVILSVMLMAPANVLADDIIFHDSQKKIYNGNPRDKFYPESPVILNNSFSVTKRTVIYFKLEGSPDNCVFENPNPDWYVRLVLKNSTWSYTDFGIFRDKTPSNFFTAVPGYVYTLRTQFHFPNSEVNMNDTYEVSVILAIDSETSYNPSYSLTHLVQFSEEPPNLPPLPPIATKTHEAPPILLVISLIAVGIFAGYFIIERRKKNEKD